MSAPASVLVAPGPPVSHLPYSATLLCSPCPALQFLSVPALTVLSVLSDNSRLALLLLSQGRETVLAPDRPDLWVSVEDITAYQPVGPLQHCSWDQKMSVSLLPSWGPQQYVEIPLLVSESLSLAAHSRLGILQESSSVSDYPTILALPSPLTPTALQ